MFGLFDRRHWVVERTITGMSANPPSVSILVTPEFMTQRQAIQWAEDLSRNHTQIGYGVASYEARPANDADLETYRQVWEG